MSHTIETKFKAPSKPGTPLARGAGTMRRFLLKILEILVTWQERAEQRHALRELDSRMLKDLGIGAGDAYRESHKPFWRL